ncbi:MAG: serine hydrolase [bacterium]|nr:serine hydrolase [bacterium]
MAILLISKSANKDEEIAPPIKDVSSSETMPLTEYSSASEIPARKDDDQIKVSAAGAYLMDSAEPLYAFRSQKQWPIASVTKLMTTLVARKLMAETETITMTEEAIAAHGEAGDFKTGEKFRVLDLVQAMLLVSSNDAAKALADNYGEETFVAEMNRVATGIGMTDTIFVDATGLSARNLSTSNDLSRLVRFIWSEDPGIFTITRLPYANIHDIDGGRSRKLTNINLFAGRSNFLGGKTGQIPDSNGNLVSIFNLPDKSSPVIIVVLGAEDRFKETEKILSKL